MRRRRPGRLLGAVIWAPSAIWAAPAAAGEIRIWPTAMVEADVVTLADAAEITGFDTSKQRQLAGLIVHAAPRAGGEILLRVKDVDEALAEAGFNSAGVKIFGASRCRVQRARVETLKREPTQPRPRHARRAPPKLGAAESRRMSGASPGSLESLLRAHIASRVKDNEGRLEIRFGPTCEAALALSEPDYSFVIQSSDRRMLGLQSFEVDIRRKGEPTRTVPIIAEVTLVRDVVVAWRAVNQGQVVTGRDLRLEERRFERLEDVGLTELAAAIGMQSRKLLRAGEMLDARSLETKPLVERGDLVKILMIGDGLEIRTSGTAQEAGSLGDLVTVRRDGAKRKQDLIDAVVTGPGLVSYRSGVQLVRPPSGDLSGQMARR